MPGNLTTSQMEELLNHVAIRTTQSGILSGVFFNSLRDGRLSREVFTATQKQFFFAVGHFSCPMAALAARISCSTQRNTLIHNLADEHGFCDGDQSESLHSTAVECGAANYSQKIAAFDSTLAHDQTFLSFLQTLGVSASEMQQTSPQTVVQAFNASLMGICAYGDKDTAFGCLGAIEFVFADISTLIGRSVVDRGWIREHELVHYKLHAEIDKQHAVDFFQAATSESQVDFFTDGAMGRGIELGLYLFDRLYSDLLKEATFNP